MKKRILLSVMVSLILLFIVCVSCHSDTMANLDEQLLGTWVLIDPIFGNEEPLYQLTFKKDGTVSLSGITFAYQLSDNTLTFISGLYPVPSILEYDQYNTRSSQYYYSFVVISNTGVSTTEGRECLYLKYSEDSQSGVLWAKK